MINIGCKKIIKNKGMKGCISFCRYWASPIEDAGSLRSGARYSLGLVTVPLLGNGTATRLPPNVVTHSTSLMQLGSKNEILKCIRMKQLLGVLTILLMCGVMLAQGDISYKIPVLAELSDGQVKLRWAPGSPMIWEEMRRTGIYVDRHTLMRDGKMLPLAERQAFVRLTVEPLRPSPEEAFGSRAETDAYIAIGGQALYGESFEVTSNQGDNQDMGALINTAKDQQNRFYFGLFAADQSWEAATMMALGFTDKDIKRNETYLYRIRPAGEIALLDTMQSCFVSIDAKNEVPGPKVQDLDGNFGDKSVTISWDMEVAQSYYTSYWIEISGDGLSWEYVNKEAFVPVTKVEGQTTKAFFQTKLPENDRPYFFRVTGRSPFGSLGTPSDPVQGMGLDPLPMSSPSIASVFPAENGSFDIAWTMADTSNVVAYQVFRARRDDGVYDPISERLAPEVRSFRDSFPMPSNYYRIAMYDKYERSMSSYSILAQPDDSIPPAPPANLRGVILKDGRVIVNWDANTEPDLLGYRIWISNQAEAEYTLATGEILKNNYFIGETTLNTLSSELYVKATALDIRHNPSAFTDYAVLIRPDTIPPAAPLLTDMRADTGQLVVEWAFSQSIDIARHELYRRPLKDSVWQLIATYESLQVEDSGSYRDTQLPRGKRFEYRLDAIDHVELRASSNILEGCIIDNFIRKSIENIKATADRRAHTITLSWTYQPENEMFSYYEIYRAGPNEPFRLIVKANQAQAGESIGRKGAKNYRFTDQDPLNMNTEYRYQIRAVYSDGGQSRPSDAVSVVF